MENHKLSRDLCRRRKEEPGSSPRLVRLPSFVSSPGLFRFLGAAQGRIPQVGGCGKLLEFQGLQRFLGEHFGVDERPGEGKCPCP